ncbi:hypothetical protein V2A60_008659 [Cordyceps javanica]
MARTKNAFRADTPEFENSNHVPPSTDDRSSASATEPASSAITSSKKGDVIETLSTVAGGAEASGSVNVSGSGAMDHGQEHANSRPRLVPSQHQDPAASPGGAIDISVLAARASEASESTDTQELPQPQAAGDRYAEDPIFIHSSDGEQAQEPTNKRITKPKGTKRATRRKAANHGSAVNRGDDSSNAGSIKGPVVPSARSRPPRIGPRNTALPTTAPPPSDDNANETTSIVGPAGALGFNRATKNNEIQSISDSVGVTDGSSRQRVLQPELEESLSGAPRYAEGARVADTSENAGVGELGPDDRPQAQNVGSDAGSDNESASFDIGQHAMARQGSTKRKRSATKKDMAAALQKRRQISGFSAQMRYPNEAFRHSSSDSAGAQNGDVADSPSHHRRNHGTENRPAQDRGPQVGMRNFTAGGSVSQADEKVAGNMSDTTQEVDWSPPTRGRPATNIPQWRLSNATLLGVDLDEDKFLQYKIAGLWNLARDGEPSLSGTAATAWILSIGGPLNLVKSNDSIEQLRSNEKLPGPAALYVETTGPSPGQSLALDTSSALAMAATAVPTDPTLNLTQTTRPAWLSFRRA